MWVRSPLEEMKYLLKFIFPFLRSGVEAKRGDEFCHSTRSASRNRQKMGNVCGIQREADFFLIVIFGSSSGLKLFTFKEISVFQNMSQSTSTTDPNGQKTQTDFQSSPNISGVSCLFGSSIRVRFFKSLVTVRLISWLV